MYSPVARLGFGGPLVDRIISRAAGICNVKLAAASSGKAAVWLRISAHAAHPLQGSVHFGDSFPRYRLWPHVDGLMAARIFCATGIVEDG